MYEIYYNNGGHCGPFLTWEAAVNDARGKLKGCRTMTRVEVRPRSSPFIGGYAHANANSTYVTKKDNGDLEITYK